ncbi:MAG: DNA polymerase subunit beta [Sulfurovum sp. FS08-3]|nr:MAG: DNA polymerase subunit beta [Sulfurovum sp. FS08-3]
MDIEKIKLEIIDRLKPLNPNKIVLFGSYAYGTPHQDSDIDLYVVTNDDFMPQNWREKSRVYLKIANRLDDIMSKTPVDLIVHTKQMYRKFKELNGSFYRNDIEKGQILWQQN